MGRKRRFHSSISSTCCRPSPPSFPLHFFIFLGLLPCSTSGKEDQPICKLICVDLSLASVDSSVILVILRCSFIRAKEEDLCFQDF